VRSVHLKLTISIFLIAATILVYWQLTRHDFVTFDDITYVTENSYIQSGLTMEGISWSFTTFRGANWHPVTWLSHMLDCQLFGLNPGMHHMTSLFFHIANTILLFLIIGKMTGSLWRSAFVAALFALHPLHVESVAWVAERKDVLSTLFWMLTLWAYVRYVELPSLIRYLPILLFFILGFMAKSMIVTLPFVLLLLDYWPLGRLQLPSPEKRGKLKPPKLSSFRLIAEKIPLLIFVALLSIVTLLAEGRAVQSLDNFQLMARISNALVSYVTYIRMMFWPAGLAVFYPYPQTIPIWKALGAGLMLICLTGIFIKAARTRPHLFVGWFWYLGTLVPVIGLVQVGNQAMADRYTYIPLIGLFIMIAWGIPDVLERWRYRQIALWISAGLLLSALTVCTWLQVRHWKNTISLFTHALNVTANNYLAHSSLGARLMDKGRHNEALKHYYEALRIKPQYPLAHYNLANAKSAEGEYEAAIEHFLEVVRLEPKDAKAHYNLGVLLARKGDFSAAVKHYTKALSIRPNDAKTHNNLAVVLVNLGKFDEAVRRLSYAVRVNPNDAVLHYNLGVVLSHLDKLEDAIREFRAALRIRPDYPMARHQLELALKQHENVSFTSQE